MDAPVPDWPHLLVLMAKGNGPDPALTGVVRGVDDGREARQRVFKKGRLIRRESLDGQLRMISGERTVWIWRGADDVPTAWPADRGHFGGLDAPLTSRRELDEWAGNDFTTPTGPATATTFLGRAAWKVELAPPRHKPYPLTLVVDAATGLVLSQRNEGFGSVVEWEQLDLDVDLPDDMFEWTGESQPPPDHHAEHEREMATRRGWLDEHGVGPLTVTLPVELMLHEWRDDGAFHASVEARLTGSLQRRPHSEEEWDTTRLGWPYLHRWSSDGWDWLLATGDEVTDGVVDQIEHQLSNRHAVVIDPVDALAESHRVQRLITHTTPTMDVPDQVKELRCSLIEEEADEFRSAVEAGDLVGVADAIADLLYVVYGAALTFGIPVREVFTEVHHSNMTKLGDDGLPSYRDDGKVLKGPNFRPPDLLPILRRAGYEPDAR